MHDAMGAGRGFVRQMRLKCLGRPPACLDLDVSMCPRKVDRREAQGAAGGVSGASYAVMHARSAAFAR